MKGGAEAPESAQESLQRQTTGQSGTYTHVVTPKALSPNFGCLGVASKTRVTFFSILQMEEIMLKEVKELTPGHSTSMVQQEN